MNEPVDVLVVGAGTIGLGIAWRSALRGLRVRVLERSRPGAGASSAAGGLLAPGDPAEWVDARGAFNLASMAAWDRFAAELEEAAGTSIGHRRDGALRVAFDDAQRDRLELISATLSQAGVEHHMLDADGCAAEEPGLRGAVAGLLAPGDAHVDAGLLVEALARACARAGVEISTGVTPVATIADGGGAVGGLRLSDGMKQPAGLTILAAGAWSSQVAWLPHGTRPPVRPLLGEYVILRGNPEEPVVRRVVRTVHGAAIPRDGGRLWVGTTLREAGYAERPAAGEVATILSRWTQFAPATALLGFERAGCGLRPGTPDGMPFVGPSPVPGLALATGHGREGIIHTPLTSEAMAGLAAGEPMPALLVPFAADRPGVELR